MGNRGVRNGVNHFGAIFDDTAVFEISTYHVPGDVLQEKYRYVLLIAKLNELCTFFCALAEKGTVVADDSDRETVDRSPAANSCSAISGFEFFEA